MRARLLGKARERLAQIALARCAIADFLFAAWLAWMTTLLAALSS